MTASSAKPSVVAAVAIALIGGFGVVAMFEERLAASAARAESVLGAIAIDERFLSAPDRVSPASQDVERRIAALRLHDDPRRLAAALFDSVERLGRVYRLRVMSVRTRPGQAAPMRMQRGVPTLEASYVEVSLEGSYRANLRLIAALAHESLVIRLDRCSFERIRSQGRATSDVRMTLELALMRLTTTSGGQDARHRPS